MPRSLLGPGGNQHAEAAFLKANQRGGGIVHIHLLRLSRNDIRAFLNKSPAARHTDLGGIKFGALLDEGLTDGTDLRIVPHQIPAQINGMGSVGDNCAASGFGAVEEPGMHIQRIRVGILLDENFDIVELAELSLFNQVFDKGHARIFPIYQIAPVDHMIPLRRLHHLPCVALRHGQRFFTENMLPGIGRLDGNFLMKIVVAADIDDIHLRIVDHIVIIRGIFEKIQLLRNFLRIFLHHINGCVQHNLGIGNKDVEPRIAFGMHASNPACGANNRNIESLHLVISSTHRRSRYLWYEGNQTQRR